MCVREREGERGRGREREIVLSSSEVKYDLWDQKYYIHVIDVKVSNDSRCSRTLPMNVAIESGHFGWEKFVQWLGLVKDDMWKHDRIWSKAEHIKVWQLDSRTFLGQSVHSRPLSSHVPQRPGSHRNACELSLTEAIVRMTDNGMGCNMYRCVRFPHSAKNMVL